MAREFPIANGKLVTDLDGNGKKVVNVELDGYATKAYVEEAVKEAGGASNQFHKLTPETSDSKVTLKPVDGKANWVAGEVITQSIKEGSFDFTWRYTWVYESEDVEDYFEVYTNKGALNPSTATITGYGSTSWGTLECIYLTLKQPIEFNEVNGPKWMTPGQLDKFRIGTIPAGTEVTVWPVFFDDGPDGESAPYETQNFYAEYFSVSSKDLSFSDKPDDIIEVDGVSYFKSLYEDTGTDAIHIGKSLVKHPVQVSIPASTGPSRRASLVLTTNAQEESDVTWEGADEIVEAFPGAKKLAPGTTVWDVKEVMPNTFLVDRAPATSGVAITGDDGTAYTLGVDADGTLEVRR